MSWRFRKTFKVFPGVKLNLTARGLSATLGASPFSVNIGPRGVYRNVRIPGTGIWDRQRIGGPSSQPPASQPPLADLSGVPSFPLHNPPSSSATEIHSASTELVGQRIPCQVVFESLPFGSCATAARPSPQAGHARTRHAISRTRTHRNRLCPLVRLRLPSQ
jgi:hypothetical protein